MSIERTDHALVNEPRPHRVRGSTSLVNGYLVFGLNDHPDSFSGSLTLRIGVTPFGLQDLAQVTAVELQAGMLSSDYAAQKQVLDEVHQEIGNDVFVAAHTLVQKPDGRIGSP